MVAAVQTALAQRDDCAGLQPIACGRAALRRFVVEARLGENTWKTSSYYCFSDMDFAEDKR